MKNTLYTLFAISILVTGSLVLTSSSNGRGFAASSGNTGAPGESTTCRTCHGSGFNASVSIAIKDSNGVAISSYIPGQVYDAEFVVNSSGGSRFGFQLVSLAGSSPVNAFSSPSPNTRIVSLGSGRQYAEHNGKSLTNTFTSKWTAPVSGTGNVTFYGSGAAVNNNGGTSGDGGANATLTLTENVSVGIEKALLSQSFLIYPNPATDVVNVKSEQSMSASTLVEWYTVSGQLISSVELNLANNEVKQLNVSTFESGLYLMRINQAGIRSEKKIMITQ